MKRIALDFALPFACCVLSCAPSLPALAGEIAPVARDGVHDFDFTLGTFRTHIRRLQNPLSGSTTWVNYEGTKTDVAILGGRGSLEQIEADGQSRSGLGHLELMTLRLYSTRARQWSLNFSSSASGALATPSIGEFKDGVGTFLDQESYNGRTILVHQVWSAITPTSYHFEQAFSADFGRTWEANFVADLERVGRR
ncbi:MAG: hypothetical protein HY243_00800 [Proteobacteria bacterium]|nr:hypothetical protein [Pseudomonadota bacterium]